MGFLKNAYRVGDRQADIEGAEVLCSRFPDSSEESIRCGDYRKSQLQESEDFYKSANIFGKSAYLAGLYIKRFFVNGMLDEMTPTMPKRK